MLENKEIRNLKEADLYNVVRILDINDDWKRFMSLIPRDPQKENSERKYNNEDIRLIEEHGRHTGEKCPKILFDEWGTSGQIRPTLKTVQKIALQADMMRVADEIARLLGEDPPPRPERGPGAPVTEDISILSNDTSAEIRDTTAQMRSQNSGPNFPNWDQILSPGNHQSTAEANSQESDFQPTVNQQYNYPQSNAQTNDFQQSEYQQSLPNIPIFQDTTEKTLSSIIDKSILQDSNLTQFDYNELQSITSNFSDDFKIGTGGFGEVFQGPHPSRGVLAIKKTNVQLQQKPEVVIKIFNSEVKYLSQFRHENILPILGFSKNGPVPCIVCEYIEGGSLYRKIAEKTLSERQRINIMRGTAEGLRYLHSYTVDRLSASASDPSMQSVSKTNFVHGDVKSANILLTKDLIPKLCDFGLAKQYEQTCMTPNVFGTATYMAPEALQGTVTQKSDIYSYGIVVLELLTGLKPLVLVNEPSEQIQIKMYIDESIKRHGKTIMDFLDPSAGGWTRSEELYALANRCTEYDRHNRPASEDICNVLHAFENN